MFLSSAGMLSIKGLLMTLDSSQPLRTPRGCRTKLQPSIKLHAAAAAVWCGGVSCGALHQHAHSAVLHSAAVVLGSSRRSASMASVAYRHQCYHHHSPTCRTCAAHPHPRQLPPQAPHHSQSWPDIANALCCAALRTNDKCQTMPDSTEAWEPLL
jgi:hypothetical protein